VSAQDLSPAPGGRGSAHPAELHGVYRVEARLDADERPRSRILSNPVHPRDSGADWRIGAERFALVHPPLAFRFART